jgi:type IV pilus assembly protein PilC
MELEEKGLYLLSVHHAGSLKLGSLRLGLPTRKRIPTPEFLVFNQELATLLKAGLPLVQSLDILRRRVPNPFFRAALDDIYEKVRSGTALSEPSSRRSCFRRSGVLMASEKSGSLEGVIRRYVEHIKVLSSVRSKVVSALIYPVVLVALSAVVVGLIVFKVVPEFAEFYKQFGHGAELPLSTRVVVWISTNLVGSSGAIFGGLIAIVAGTVLWFRQPAQRKRLHAAVLRLPYFGPLTRKFVTAQVSRTLATLLSGGIPLVNSLGHRVAGGEQPVDGRQADGRGPAGARRRQPGLALERDLFPHVAVEMVEVGESTGALADMLNSVADFYDRRKNETEA